jgi:hypothetical protein
MPLPGGKMMSTDKQFIANLYYHGRLEQQMSGDAKELDSLLANMHLLVDSMRTGSSGNIIDRYQGKVIYSCAYQSPE